MTDGRFWGQIGPMPYDRDPADTRKCANCGLMNAPDAAVCDQCGEDMPVSPQDYTRRPGDDVMCHHCLSYNAMDALFCRICGHQIPRQAYIDEANQEKTPMAQISSSGRDGTDPVSRALFLESLPGGHDVTEDPDDGGRLFRAIDRAERAVALAEEELYLARGQARQACDDVPEADLPGEHFSDSAHVRFQTWRLAERAVLEAENNLERAHARLDRLLTQFEALREPGLGLGWSAAPAGADNDFGEPADGIAAAERAQRNARRARASDRGSARGLA